MTILTDGVHSQLQVELESQNVCVSGRELFREKGILHIDEFDDYTAWNGIWVGGVQWGGGWEAGVPLVECKWSAVALWNAKGFQRNPY